MEWTPIWFAERRCLACNGYALQRIRLLWFEGAGEACLTRCRCAIYTRKSTEEGLKQEFNSLEAQREAGEAYILSQRQSGWAALAEHYDDGGFSGASIDRPAMLPISLRCY